MPIAIGAKKVFVAAPKTLQYPKAATNKGFNPKTGAIITPRLDPIANNGVTSPPWKPADKVKIVKTNFKMLKIPQSSFHQPQNNDTCQIQTIKLQQEYPS